MAGPVRLLGITAVATLAVAATGTAALAALPPYWQSAREIGAIIEEEAKCYTTLMASPEAKEAFAAFLEKRPPDFAKARRG